MILPKKRLIKISHHTKQKGGGDNTNINGDVKRFHQRSRKSQPQSMKQDVNLEGNYKMSH